MYINIKPQYNKHYNCMDFYCKVIAELANRNYECIFMNQWDFDFNENSNSLGEGIYFYNRNYPIMDEKNYKLMFHHGIEIKYHYTNSYEEVMTNLYEYLKYGRPLLVRFDGAIMDWGNELDKTIRRYKQMFLVIGVTKSQIMYFDTHDPSHVRQMDIDLFKKGCILHYKDAPFKTIYSTFNVVDDPSKNYDHKFLLTKSLENLSKSLFSENKFSALRNFSEKIRLNFNPCNEILPNTPIEYSRLMERLTLITGSRNRYGIFIKYLKNKFNLKQLEFVIQDFNDLTDEWYEVWCLFLKFMYMGEIENKEKEIISNKVKYISEHEERIYQKLLSIYI